MAIEIREIVIRANITEPVSKKNEAPALNRKAVIEECTRRVLQRLKKQSTR
jgi:hypothetical protein